MSYVQHSFINMYIHYICVFTFISQSTLFLYIHQSYDRLSQNLIYAIIDYNAYIAGGNKSISTPKGVERCQHQLGNTGRGRLSE